MKVSTILNRIVLVPLIMILAFLISMKLGYTFTVFEGITLTLIVDILFRITDLQASYDALAHVILADKSVKEVDLIRNLINAELNMRDGRKNG